MVETSGLPDHIAALITPPLVSAWVAQRQGTHFLLGWQDAAERVDLYGLAEPSWEGERTLLRTVRGEQQVWVETTAVRPYFALHFHGGTRSGQHLIVAERRLPLQGVANFRDIGGYVGENGRFTRWGKVYRSGDLHEAKTADLAYLSQLDLQNICDLRTPQEVATRPNQLPRPNPLLTNVALKSRDTRWRQLFDLFRYRMRLEQLLIDGYSRVILKQNAPLLGLLLTQLADETCYPLLVHCTAGKDRTGIFIALLLRLLGVPESVVLADYSLSNHHYTTFRRVLQDDVQQLVRFGFDVERLEPFYVANTAVLQTVLNDVQTAYGSVTNYVSQEVGIGTSVLNKIKATLLEPDR